jgi:PAS domain S-box-containing protein
MPNDVTEPQPSASPTPLPDLETQEGVEDFACSSLWLRSTGLADGPLQPSEQTAKAQLTLAQAIDLLELEIVKRREAEAGVREREERFRQMSRYLGKFFWLSDANTNKLVYVSPGYEQIWQTKRDACYPTPEDWLEDTPPDDEPAGSASPEPNDKTTADGTEYQAVGQDGALRWIRERMFPIHDADGKRLYTLGIAEDITDLKGLEAACGKEELMKRAFVRLVPDSIFKLRADGTILEFKPSKDDPQLRPSTKLRGKKISSLLPEETARRALHCIQRALATGRTQTLCLQYQVADTLRDFEVRSVACGHDEVLVLARDMTGRRSPEPVETVSAT